MIVVGLGGNVGDDAAIVDRFRRARGELGAVRSARLYRSAAIGPEQRDYLNSAIALADAWEPLALLATLHAIEAANGRARDHEERWGPRTLDLDVLIWVGREVALPQLVVPHPRLRERRFALLPVADLAGSPWRELAAAVVDQRVDAVAESW
jgi:2-amino-4-hydroxy-6-hydroxymethyldihydropteridine diphosphokinase|nr:2-amino-4-hydroxy-6-hydroxymethyldihydropteridine diphosphokinase [Kofleriaceae bacterium]